LARINRQEREEMIEKEQLIQEIENAF